MTPLPDTLLESDAASPRLASPLGKLLVVHGPNGLVRIGFEEEPEDHALAQVASALGPRIVASDRELGRERDALSASLEGDTAELDLPVDLRLMAAPFRHRVLE